jgi:hypothetical protein
LPGPELKVTEHEFVDPVAVEGRIQVLVGLKGEAMQFAEGLHVQEIVPEGVIAVPEDVSITVALHVVEWLSTTLLDAQLTLVEVARFVTCRLFEPELP